MFVSEHAVVGTLIYFTVSEQLPFQAVCKTVDNSSIAVSMTTTCK